MIKAKTFWTHIRDWFDKDKYAFSTVAILSGLFFLYHHLTRDTLKSDNDLVQINGPVKDYSFADKQRGLRTTHEYYVWLDNYENAFQIKADFLDYFKKNEFKAQVRKGDSILLTIPKQKTIYLNAGAENIYVLSIDHQNKNYLDKTKTMKTENSGFDLYATAFFLLIGTAYYLFKKRHAKTSLSQ
jgi:hypothetical protein